MPEYFQNYKFYITLSASSCEIAVNGVPFTSKIESPGRSPARSATLPSSTREIYTPTPIFSYSSLIGKEKKIRVIENKYR